MKDQVTLTVTNGPMKGQTFVFEKHDILLFGRAKDCHIRLAREDRTASRYHFLLEVNPPDAQIRDVGSLHGTWLNRIKIGCRKIADRVPKSPSPQHPEVNLKDGDEIRVGKHVMRVQMELARTEIIDSKPNSIEQMFIKELRVNDLSDVPKIAAYHIKEVLGRGGFGSVYLIEHKQSHQQAALKIMRAETVVNRFARNTFQREIRTVKTLNHKHLIQFLDDGAVGDTFYFMMEFCEDGNLSQLIQKHGGKLPLREAVLIMRQVLKGVAFIHRQGTIHRDLKPANILFARTKQGRVVKIGDFGLAKGFIEAGLSGLTATKDRAGTLNYIPKEQITKFRDLTPVSDVWSLGATFYVMLTGHYPRQGSPGQDPIQLVLSGQPIPIRQRNPKIPPSIAEVIDRALQVDPEARYRTAAHMLRALDQALSSK